jgi:SpoIIAA-like
MIEGIAGMPDGTFGLRVWGEVTRDDYVHGVLDPLREAIGRGESIRLLFQVGPGFEKFTAGLLAADATQGAALGLGHLSAWKRTAVVTDVEWIRRSTELLGWMTPGEVRVFPTDQLDAAKAWVAG